MGLAAAQVQLLALTARKNTCETNLAIDSGKKMALTREMSELSQEYYSRLQSKSISYYDNGDYHKINYNYLMGDGLYTNVLNRENRPLKDNNSMILTDYKGQVVLSEHYAKAITSVLGASAMNNKGQGGTFSSDKIPAILAAVCPGFEEEKFKTVINGGKITDSSYDANANNTMSGQDTGKNTTVDNSATVQEKYQALVDFYLPIFNAAASNGWTTEYNKEMCLNDNYVSDALVSGSFQLATVNDDGSYHENDSLTYFVTAGYVESRTDSDVREEITAWYNAEKERISEKETFIDLHMDELSTELEAINTEIQSVQSIIDDATSSIFDWGTA